MAAVQLLRRLGSVRQPSALRYLQVKHKGSSSSSFGGSTSTYNALLMGGGAVAIGVVVASVLRSRKKYENVGLPELYSQKSVEYKVEGAVHPEAVAEAALVSSDTKSVTDDKTPSPAPSSTVPTNTVEETITDTSKSDMIPDHVPYVLIGAGTASFAAAKSIKEKDPKAKILIIGDEEYTPYSRPPLSKQLWLYENHDEAKQLKFKASWSGGRVVDVFYKYDFCKPSDLMQQEQGGVAVLTGRKAVGLDPRSKSIKLSDGSTISYNKCLLATGGEPKNLEIFNQASKEVQERTSTYRKIPDYKELDNLLDRAKSIAIVGGGFLGSELAVGLAKRGLNKDVKITQVFPEVGNLGLVLPEDLSKWTTDKVRKEGVNVFPGSLLKEVSFEKDQVVIVTQDDKQIEADHVVVAVGLQPNTDLSKSARLEVDPTFGGFRVNAELQACTDVWAAGDVACFFDPYLGRRRVEHHDHANVSGSLAGKNMAGGNERFDHQSMFWSDVGSEVGFEATGKIDAKLPTVGIFARKSDETVDKLEDDYSKGVVFYLEKEKGRIVGVLTWNMFGKMDTARQIVMEEKTEEDIGDIAAHFPVH